MTQEDKELLLKDLSARLPYGVVVELDEKFGFNKGTRTLVKELLDLYCVVGIKPYLRPMSSMTEEERSELSHYYNAVQRTDFFYSHHIDCRFMIEKSLAIEVTEANNPYKE